MVSDGSGVGSVRSAWISIGLGLLLQGCGGDGVCDSTTLIQLLEAASAGDVIELGECTISGGATIPTGVTLSGRGIDRSTIALENGAAPIELMPGDPPARLRDLSVESDAIIAVLARGAGEVVIERVSVRATRGVAIGLEDLSHAVIDAVTLEGPHTSTSARTLPTEPLPQQTATHGLVAVRVVDADLNALRTSGFATSGASFAESDVHWQGGHANANVSLGIACDGGSLELTDVEIASVIEGTGLRPAYAGSFIGGAIVDSLRLRVTGSAGFGLLHDGSSGAHLELIADDNHETGVWAQANSSLEISGALRRNRFAGIVAVDANSVSVHDAQIDSTVAAVRFGGSVGDGIHLVRSVGVTSLARLELSDNERAGIFLELAGSTITRDRFDDVTVNVSAPNAFGVVAQGGVQDSGWDDEIIRNGQPADEDRAASGLDFVSIVGPCNMPRPDELRSRGLEALIGP